MVASLLQLDSFFVIFPVEPRDAVCSTTARSVLVHVQQLVRIKHAKTSDPVSESNAGTAALTASSVRRGTAASTKRTHTCLTATSTVVGIRRNCRRRCLIAVLTVVIELYVPPIQYKIASRESSLRSHLQTAIPVVPFQ